MGCWKIVDRHKNDQVRQTRLVLNRKRDEEGAVCKQKTCLTVFVNKEVDFREASFSLVADYLLNNLIFSFWIQRESTNRRIDLVNVFRSRQLERRVYVEVQRHLLSKEEKVERYSGSGGVVMVLRMWQEHGTNFCSIRCQNTVLRRWTRILDYLYITRQWSFFMWMIWYF